MSILALAFSIVASRPCVSYRLNVVKSNKHGGLSVAAKHNQDLIRWGQWQPELRLLCHAGLACFNGGKVKKKINIRSQPTNVEVCNWTPGMFVDENYSNLKKICTQPPKVSLLMFSPTRGRDLLFETFLCCFINARNKNVLLIDGCKNC